MKIGIYARGLSESSGGPKVYIECLTKELVKIIPDNCEFYIFHNLKNKYLTYKKSNVYEIILRSNSKMICDYVLGPIEINKLKLDVCLFPKDIIPMGIICKKIVTIYDLAYFLPEYNAYKLIDTKYMQIMIPYSCKIADKIISISNNTKKDLVSLLKVDPKKVETIYLGSNIKKTSKKDCEKILKKYNLKKKFIFYSGTISPRKNIVRLIKAFNKIQDTINCDLIITGTVLWNNKKEMELIKKNKRIRLIGKVSKKELEALYTLAEAYIYPSLYEGFGLPILEAQACGCPVITSNVSSMPEVAGKGALLVDPYKVNEISNAIKKVIIDKELRQDLIKKGFENCKKFSWKKCAKEIMHTCKGVVCENV